MRRSVKRWVGPVGLILLSAIPAVAGSATATLSPAVVVHIVTVSVFGTAMAVSLVLGIAAVLRRDFARHRAWTVRGYAIGLGAGTQAFTHAVFIAAAGPVTKTGKAFAMLAGRLINVAVAELVIRRPLVAGVRR